MKDALTIHRALLELCIHHEIVRLRQDVLDTDELPQALGVPTERCLAVRLHTTEDRVLACLLRSGQTPPATALLSLAGYHEVRPAPPDLVNRVVDYAAGLVAPLLLPDGVELYTDRSLSESYGQHDIVYTATGESGTALGIHMRDLLSLSGAVPVELTPRTIRFPRLPGAVRPGSRLSGLP